MTVEEVLEQKGRQVHTIEGTATLAEAARALHQANIGCIAVLSRGSIMGLVGEREITHAVAQAGPAALQVTVQKVMTRLTACSSADDLESISRRMTGERVRHILVLDAGRMAGIISIGDVLKHRLDQCQLEVGVLRDVARSRVLSH